MNKYIIQLKGGKVGWVVSANPPIVGHEMTVTLQDENGNHIPITGVVEAILETKASWE